MDYVFSLNLFSLEKRFFISAQTLGAIFVWPLRVRSFVPRFATKIHANLVFQACNPFELLERQFKETLTVSYLVLQACILLLRCFKQEWHI